MFASGAQQFATAASEKVVAYFFDVNCCMNSLSNHCEFHGNATLMEKLCSFFFMSVDT